MEQMKFLVGITDTIMQKNFFIYKLYSVFLGEIISKILIIPPSIIIKITKIFS